MEEDPVELAAAAEEVAEAAAELRVIVRVVVQLDEAEVTYVAEDATWVLATTEEVAAAEVAAAEVATAEEVAAADEAAEEEPELLPEPEPPTVKSTQDS